MNNEKRCELLAQEIDRIFRRGLKLGDDVRHYIDSTFAHPTTEALQEILADADDADVMPLIELIFFPDEAIQAELEDLLSREGFQDGDDEKVLRCLLCRNAETRIHLPGSGEAIPLPVPEWAAGEFIARLKISGKADPRLVQAIHEHVAAGLQTPFKVKLRNSRFVPSDKKILFLCNLLDRIDAGAEEMAAIFDFTLAFLDEIDEGTAIFKALMDKKKRYFRSAEQAVKYEEALKTDNMETLLLRGVRMPHIDRGDALYKMGIIDRIATAVFGRTEHLAPVSTGADLGGYDAGDLKKVIDSLS
ncbi:hypothetical protein DENIS_1843 [Desulfonema ishimotonii]|uniref:Uncharacterized protein n=1 Tax=Desulfonema ishimotonii TaxID=45657 RepID=A0A401FVA1_9BACT|nr:hypothetical protein [Desulfonema ishimotonii]GBC60883.1 hypothetical protein DENIS_1843 [Desulfonema ishimotonii]